MAHKIFIAFFLTLLVPVNINSMEKSKQGQKRKAAQTEVDHIPHVPHFRQSGAVFYSDALLTYITDCDLVDVFEQVIIPEFVLNYRRLPHVAQAKRISNLKSFLLQNLSLRQILYFDKFLRIYENQLKANKEEACVLIMALFLWIQNNRKRLDILVSFDNIKMMFENECAKSIDIVSGEAEYCVPYEVAQFFPFLRASLEGGFKESGSKKFILSGEVQPCTLRLFKKALYTIYRKNVLKPVDPKEIDYSLLHYLFTIIQEEAMQAELPLLEVLELAHRYDITILINAVLQVLHSSVNDGHVNIENLAQSIPLEYFPGFCGGSPDICYFVLRLLGEKLNLATHDEEHITEIVSAYTDRFLATILDWLASEEYNVVMNNVKWKLHPLIEKKITQGLIERYYLPNFMRIWDIAFYSKVPDCIKHITPTRAYRHAYDEVIFLGANNEVIVYGDSMDDYRHTHPDYRDRDAGTGHIGPNGKPYMYHHVVIFNACEPFIVAGELQSGLIRVTPNSDEIIPKIIDARASLYGKIMALAAVDRAEKLALVIAYDSGALEVFDITTGAHRAELEPVQRSTNGKAVDHVFKCCYHNNILAVAYTNGCIKLYDMNNMRCINTIKTHELMQSEKFITSIDVHDEMLAIGARNGCMYFIDRKNGENTKILPAIQASNKLITCYCRLNEHYVAVGYGDGRVCIWDIAMPKIVRTILGRYGDKYSNVRGLGLIKGKLEIIYDDYVIDHYIIPEVISLLDLINHMYDSRELGSTD